MKTSGVPQKLQEAIRNHFAGVIQSELAKRLGISESSAWLNASQESYRDVTYHFCGLLAVNLPDDWTAIQLEAGRNGRHIESVG